MIVPKKTFAELMDAAITRLSANTPITNFAPGSIARGLLEVTNSLLGEFYDVLDFNLAMAFVSHAKGYYLDLIGDLLDCKRRDGESDDNYRYRICHQVYVVAGCNLTALRLELLSIDGVRDVIFTPYTFGTGSFSVYVVPEAGVVLDTLLQAVQKKLDEKIAYGIRAQALEPILLPVDIKIRLVFSQAAQNKEIVVTQVQKAVWEYIANLRPGKKIIISELVQRIMDVSEDIMDMEIYYFYIDDRPVLVTNQESAWDEVFYPRLIEVS